MAVVREAGGQGSFGLTRDGQVAAPPPIKLCSVQTFHKMQDKRNRKGKWIEGKYRSIRPGIVLKKAV